MNEKELLDFAVKSGIIDISVIQQKYIMTERQKYLTMHQYKIYHSSDGKWRTYLPVENGRKLIKRNTQEEVERVVVDYYKGLFQPKEVCHTIRKLFPQWLTYKSAKTQTTSYPKKITTDWKKFYDKDSIADQDIKSFTKIDLEIWAHKKIKDNHLTKRAYYNMSMILRQCLDYAVEKGYIKENVFRDAKINTKLFVRQKKKKASMEVYSHDEVPIIIGKLKEKFDNNPDYILPIAVMLDFELGLRAGEISALKFSDVDEDYIQIQRQTVGEFEKVDDFTMSFSHYKVADYTKSDDGYREVYLTKRAKELIEVAWNRNNRMHEHDDDFIFLEKGKVINTLQVQQEIRHACKSANIPVRSIHKVRKTYISELIQSGMNIDEVRRLAGHSDERTTLNNYCFSVDSDAELKKKLESALNHGVVGSF